MIAALIQSERKVRDLFGGRSGCDFARPCRLDACAHSGPLPKLLVFRRTDGAPELIGMVGLDRSGGGDPEFVCWIARAHRSEGYGTEAARALMQIAREGLRLKRLVARRQPGGASARLLARLGFRGGELVLTGEPAGEAMPAPLQAVAA